VDVTGPVGKNVTQPNHPRKIKALLKITGNHQMGFYPPLTYKKKNAFLLAV